MIICPFLIYYNTHLIGLCFVEAIVFEHCLDIVISHLPGRPLRINLMSRYICFSQNGRFDVSFEELFSKAKNPGGFFRKNVF